MADQNMVALARKIAGAPNAKRPYVAALKPRFTRGLVCAFNADGTLSVCIDGGPSALNCDKLSSAVVDVGDVVELHTFGTRMVVDGKLSHYKGGWIPLTLTGNWAAYGSGYQTPAYRVVGNEVILRGLVKNPNSGGSAQGIFALSSSTPGSPPPPTADEFWAVFATLGSIGLVRVQAGGPSSPISANNFYVVGYGVAGGTAASVADLSLSGIRWYID